MFTALVGTEKYEGINGFGDTAGQAIDECMRQIMKVADPEADEIIVGFWTPTGIIAKPMNMWLRYTHPEATLRK